MAAIQHLTDETTAVDTHTGDVNWTDITGASLTGHTGSKKYLIIVNALFGLDNVSNQAGFRVLHGSTVFDSSFANMEVNSTGGALNGFFWWTVFTQPGSPEDIKCQFRTAGSTRTVSADEIRIHAINLTDDLTEGTDWSFAEDTSGPTQHTTTPVDRVSLVFTPVDAGDDWLILARNETIIDSLSVNAEMLLLEDGSEAITQTSKEGESILENLVYSRLYVAEGLSAAEHTFKVQTLDDATGTNDYDTAALFRLNLNKFESHSVIHTAAGYDYTADTTWEELATVTHTPTTTGDHLILGDALTDFASLNTKVSHRLQFGGTSDPTNWESSLSQMDPNDNTDQFNGPIAVMRSIADTGIAIDLDGQVSTGFDAAFALNRTIVAFSMELAAAGPVPGKIII